MRPKVSVKQKRAIAARARPLPLPHLPATSQLDVHIPTGTHASTTETITPGRPISEKATQGEHLATPVHAEDLIAGEGPWKPEAADTLDSQETVVLREGSARRASLTEPNRGEDNQQKTRHNSATP